MRTLAELVLSVREPMLVYVLGGVAIAYSDRSRARQKLKEADAAVREAETNLQQSGRFYICGDHYDYRKDEAIALRLQRVDEKRAKEKHFKKLCHEYVEAGGTRETIDELIEILVRDET